MARGLVKEMVVCHCLARSVAQPRLGHGTSPCAMHKGREAQHQQSDYGSYDLLGLLSMRNSQGDVYVSAGRDELDASPRECVSGSMRE